MRKIIFLFFLFFFCSSNKEIISIGENYSDWPTYCKDYSRNNLCLNQLDPPLRINWKKNLNSAASEGFIFKGNSLIVPVRNGKIHFLNYKNGDILRTVKTKTGLIGTPSVSGDNLIIPGTGNRNNFSVYSVEKAKFSLKENVEDIEISPAIYSDSIFFGTLSGKFYSVSMDGRKNWEFDCNSAVYSSPALSGNFIVFGTLDGKIYCLNADNGSLNWEFDSKQNIFSTCIIFENKVYFGNSGGDVFSLFLETGEVNWHKNVESEILGAPVTNGELVIVGTDSGQLSAFDMSGFLKWQIDLGSVIKIPPLISGKICYIGNLKKYLYAVNIENGEVIWEEHLGGRIKTAIVQIGNKLYVAVEDNKLICLESDKK